MRNVALAGAACLALSTAAAEAQQCYRRVVEPPLFTMVPETVMVTPAHDVNEYVPAVTRLLPETVVVRPAETVTRVIPPQFGYQDQTVEVSPAHREWRTRDEDGEIIGCWVNVPARFARLTRRVLIAPAREVAVTIPEETTTRLRAEIVEPAHVVVHTVPARYVTHERQVLAAPGGAHWAPIGACEP